MFSNIHVPKWYSFYAVTVACSFAFALFGYDTSLMSGILSNKDFKRQFNNPDDTMTAHITSIFDLGCFITAVAAAALGDAWSRKKTVMLGCAIHIIGGIIQTCSYTAGQLIAGRLIAGLGNGFITVAVPVWQSECTPAPIRGRVVGFLCFLNSVGGVLISWINFGLLYAQSNSVSWRFPMALQILLSGVTIIMTPFLAESPRWLVIKNRFDDAKTTLSGLSKEPVGSDVVETEFMEIKFHVEREKEIAASSHFRNLFRKNDKMKNSQRILMGAASQFMQQWGGINVILYYATVLFEDSLGFTPTLAYILSACIQMNYAICTFITAYLLMDKVGRKPLMFWGALLQGICYLMVAVALSIGTHKSSIVAISFMFVYYTVFGFSWGPSAWLYPTEINSLQYRNTGAGTSTATNWIFNYIIVLITPTGTKNIGWKYYLIYAVMNFSFLPIIYWFFEETAGLTLEEVDELFEYGDRTKTFHEIVPFNHRKRILKRGTGVVVQDKPETENHVEDIHQQ